MTFRKVKMKSGYNYKEMFIDLDKISSVVFSEDVDSARIDFHGDAFLSGGNLVYGSMFEAEYVESKESLLRGFQKMDSEAHAIIDGEFLRIKLSKGECILRLGCIDNLNFDIWEAGGIFAIQLGQSHESFNFDGASGIAELLQIKKEVGDVLERA